MRAQVRISQPKVASVPLAIRACCASSSVAAGKVSRSASAWSPYSAAYRLAELLEGLRPRRAAEHGHLVGVRADDDRHVVLPSRREDVVDGVGEDPAVDVGRRQDQLGRDALHRVRARGPHGLERRRRAVAEQGLDEALAGRLDLRLGRGPAPRAEAAAALADGGVEEAARERRRHQLVDAPRAGRLAEDGHARRVAPERGDVPLDPAEGGDLVEEAVVARRPVPGLGAQQRVGEIAERPEAVVDGHQHDAAPGQPRPVVGDVGAVADSQPAAVDPDQHGGAVIRRRRRPDVQVEAVLVHAVDARVVERLHRGGQRVLHARRRRLGRVAHALPRRRRLGGTPPQLADRRGRERHAPVDHDLFAERRRRSREPSRFDGHDRAGVLARRGRRGAPQERGQDQRGTTRERAAHHVSDHEITPDQLESATRWSLHKSRFRLAGSGAAGFIARSSACSSSLSWLSLVGSTPGTNPLRLGATWNRRGGGSRDGESKPRRTGSRSA